MGAFTGRNARIHLGKETTPGVGVSPTVRIPVAPTSDMSQPLNVEPRSELIDDDGGSGLPAYSAETGGGAEGTTSHVLYHRGQGLLLLLALGALSTSGAGPYDHTYTLDQDKPSATVEMVRGTGEAETFVGCKVNTLQISGEAGGKEVPVQVTWTGMSSSGNGTATSLSQNSGVNVAVNPNSATWTCTFGGSAVAGVRRFSVNLNNALAGRRVLGSLSPDEVVADGFASVEAEFEIDYNSVAGDTYYDAWKAGTTGDVVFKMAASSSLYVEITVQNARLIDVTRPAARMGYIAETVKMIGQSRSGSPGLKIVVRNAQSSGEAA